jgi:hypothetical protein
MSARHTPGPWISAGYGDYSDYDGKCRVILGEGGDIRTAVVLGFDSNENQANAHLIAAAPELLAALQGMLAIVSESRGVSGYHLSGDVAEWAEFPEIDVATATIAKATGGAL